MSTATRRTPFRDVALAPTRDQTVVPTSDHTIAPTPDHPVTPTRDYTVAPTRDYTIAPTPDYPVTPTRDYTIAPTPDHPVAPTRDYTVAPTRDYTIAPTPDHPVAPTRDRTVDPTRDYTIAPTPDYPVAPTRDYTIAPTRGRTGIPTQREPIFPSRDRKGVVPQPLKLYAASTALLAACLLAGCKVGPNYKQPPAPNPQAFKETPPPNFKEAEAQGWKQSEPGDAYLKGKWWEVYNDPALNALEEQVSISNQNVLAAEATYREAKAAVTVARAGLFPTVTTTPAITTTSIGKNAAGTTTAASAGAVTRSTFNLPVAASWEPDLWGSVRRAITAASSTAQATAGDLENAKLLYQSELAQDYFGLRGSDAEGDLLTRTEASYQEYLTLTRNRFNGGVASDLDVAQAESQLYAVQSQLIDLGVQRAQYEHAIATLTGKAPVEVAIPAEASMKPPPPVPIGVPSELLQRRPDIAAAERRVAAANEQIGIAIAAFYPNLTLNGSVGLEAGSLLKWFTWPARVWSVGPQLAETLFDAGRRRGVVAEQRAAYDATVATYRGTVLTAFQQVEDNLAALRILEGESAKEQETIQAANRALTVSTAQYTAGTVNYLTVITAQATLLNAEVTSVNILTRRLTASVVLIQALGGGWNTSDLPSPQTVAAAK